MNLSEPFIPAASDDRGVDRVRDPFRADGLFSAPRKRSARRSIIP
jgi:hypothetical protein